MILLDPSRRTSGDTVEDELEGPYFKENDMKMRTFIGLCAALAFAAGSTAVHAVKIVDDDMDDPALDATNARASNTYAKELLTAGATRDATDEGDTTTYYIIAEEGIYLSAKADIAANVGDTYLVTYTLDGMVFETTASISQPENDFSIAVGGQPGDRMVVFRLNGTDTTDAVLTTTLIVLDARFAISAAGSGSVTRTVTNQTIASLGIAGVDGTRVHTASGVIKLGSGVKETSMAMSPTATVEHSFRSFDGSAVATVGSLQVTHNALVRQNDEDGGPVIALMEIINDADGSDSTVDIMGDFSFATNAFLHIDATCIGTDQTPVPAAPGILKVEGTGDDMMVVGVNAQHVAAFANMMYLCIAVDPDDEDGMRIPETVAYRAMGDYEGAVENAAFDPVSVEQKLGAIKRDGTTMRLPYLTTHEKFAQRLYIVNRGAATVYEMDFQEGDTPGAKANGMLEANSRTIIVVGGTATEDALVTIGEGGSTSGSLIVEAEPHLIDVATVQVSRADGSTDTVVYTAQRRE